MRDLEVKTTLTDKEYTAMLRVVEANGFTQAGYFRHLILEDIVQSQSFVTAINHLTDSPETAEKQAENAPIKFERK